MMQKQTSPGQERDSGLLEELILERDRVSCFFFGKLDAERAEALARAELQLLRNSGGVRLGLALAAAAHSPRALLRLPSALWEVRKHLRTRASQDDGPPSTRLPPEVLVQAAADAPLRSPELPPDSIHGLRVAAVLDEFTYECFSPECEIVNLPAEGFEPILDALRPHLLLVESAWRGREDDWRDRIHPASGALAHLVGCCRRRGIQTAFWNKEDPSHFDHFIDAARLFDHVFTTDQRCVPRYRDVLGHNRIEVLGFACQPAMHNPLENCERRQIASFAGSWYAQYPERARDFEELVRLVKKVVPVEIYDRNTGRGDPSFMYPAEYRPMVREGVPYRQVGKVYKSGDFAITVNTVKDSPTMLARRVYELLASNTITVSNFSVAADRVFGDCILMAGRDHDPGERLKSLRDNDDARCRFRLRGLREVLSRHVASIRLSEISGAMIGSVPVARPSVCVAARVSSREEASAVVAMFNAQRWEERSLVLVASAAWVNAECEIDGIPIVLPENGDPGFSERRVENEWVALYDPRDYYGPCYLLDLMLATSYAESSVIGKSTRFSLAEKRLELVRGAPQYRAGALLPVRASIVSRSSLGIRTMGDLVAWVESPGDGQIGLAVDQYSYCEAGAAAKPVSVDVE
ncbi:CgeB family protein [Luteimonas salinilitoris]|uniref:Spore protein YkvP/CgeB glycosyl transferase-like domain-containing protein n=1 Tax=Luteimonas salinilitoris TaxID=3237697 RepID=A0ABV4HU95_9GAMM